VRFSGKNRSVEGLLDEIDIRVETAVVNDRTFSIAGHEDDFRSNEPGNPSSLVEHTSVFPGYRFLKVY
jgi:hypothetical protein